MQTGLWDNLTEVRIYGTPEAARIADELFKWVTANPAGTTDPALAGDYERLTSKFVQQIRRDLGVDPSQPLEEIAIPE